MHEPVGHGHQLAEHIVRRIRERNVIANTLGHLLDAVSPNEKCRGKDLLLRHTEASLNAAAHQEIQKLVMPADLNIGLHRNGIIPLKQRVERFQGGHIASRSEALSEILALHHLLNARGSGKSQEGLQAALLIPRAVVIHLSFLHINNLSCLSEICLLVLLHLRFREWMTRLGLTGWVADLAREVADDEHNFMPKILELFQFSQNDRVPEMQVGCRRVNAELHAQFFAAEKYLLQRATVYDLRCSPNENVADIFPGRFLHAPILPRNCSILHIWPTRVLFF